MHRDHSWKKMTQETRQADILRPACKEIIRIETVERIPELMRRAFAVATSGRPGPVVVDIPEDVKWHGGVRRQLHGARRRPFRSRPALPRRREIDCRSRGIIAASRAPMIRAGGGIHWRTPPKRNRLRHAFNIPSPTPYRQGRDPLLRSAQRGLFGRYDRIANALIEDADLILAIAASWGDRHRALDGAGGGQDHHRPRQRGGGVRPRRPAGAGALDATPSSALKYCTRREP